MGDVRYQMESDFTPGRGTSPPSQEQEASARTEASRAERLDLFERNGFDAL
jgi:hypothetical protein